LHEGSFYLQKKTERSELNESSIFSLQSSILA